MFETPPARSDFPAMHTDALEEIVAWREAEREHGRRVVFTNGCFDLLHAGHVEHLARARALGDTLIVGLNSDESVTRLKGDGRPYVPAEERAAVLEGLASVSRVVVFEEETPGALIEALRPDVLVKGPDWPLDRIVGRETVEAWGGEVRSLESSHPGCSTSAIARRVRAGSVDGAGPDDVASGARPAEADVAASFDSRLFRSILAEGARMRRELAAELEAPALRAAGVIREALAAGGKLLFCGNGGSAADAQHLAAEFVGRFEVERDGLSALALTTDGSILTAAGNDYGFEDVFARQTRALGRTGDVLIGLSTSGRSLNVLRAVEAAADLGMRTIGLLGRDGGEIATAVDVPVIVRHSSTARIQEMHITLGHFLCAAAERSGPAAQRSGGPAE